MGLPKLCQELSTLLFLAQSIAPSSYLYWIYTSCLIVRAKLTPALTSSQETVYDDCKANKLGIIRQGWATAHGGPRRPHFQNQSWPQRTDLPSPHQACRLVTSTHPALSKFDDSPHFISRDRVPVAIARRWQFTDLNWAVSEACRGLTSILHLMRMKRPGCCKDDSTS